MEVEATLGQYLEKRLHDLSMMSGTVHCFSAAWQRGLENGVVTHRHDK